MYYKLEKIIQDCMTSRGRGVVIRPLDSNWELIVVLGIRRHEFPIETNEVKKQFQALRLAICNQTGVECIVGIGPEISDIDNVADSYREAVDTILGCNLLSREQVFSSHDVDQRKDHRAFSVGSLDMTLSAAVRSLDIGMAHEIVRELFEHLSESRYATPKDLEFLAMELLVSVEKTLVSFGIDIAATLDKDFSPFNFGQHIFDVQSTKKWLNDVLEKAISTLVQRGNISRSDVVNGMVAYIHQHFDERIDLSVLSEKFFKCKEYISRLFKKELDLNFKELLTNVRLEKAKTLLLNSSDTVQNIAQRVGFKDEFYFSRVFKKHFGLSPRAYRSSNNIKQVK
jgi:two-component system response regulator YesN